ncbi:MAG: hypothetical protein QW524_02255 [Candidatus Woesearchaeota archaeon]
MDKSNLFEVIQRELSKGKDIEEVKRELIAKKISRQKIFEDFKEYVKYHLHREKRLEKLNLVLMIIIVFLLIFIFFLINSPISSMTFSIFNFSKQKFDVYPRPQEMNKNDINHLNSQPTSSNLDHTLEISQQNTQQNQKPQGSIHDIPVTNLNLYTDQFFQQSNNQEYESDQKPQISYLSTEKPETPISKQETFDYYFKVDTCKTSEDCKKTCKNCKLGKTFCVESIGECVECIEDMDCNSGYICDYYRCVSK